MTTRMYFIARDKQAGAAQALSQEAHCNKVVSKKKKNNESQSEDAENDGTRDVKSGLTVR